MAAYNCTLLIWLGYTLAKSPAREAPSNMLRPQRWEQSLTDIHHPLPADSLIPMFEGMVDRALSKTQASPSLVQEDRINTKAAAAHAGGAPTAVGFSGLPGTGSTRR